VATIAYEFGRTAADANGRYGLIVVIGGLVLAAVGFIAFKIVRNRRQS
jgi:hypothetical protein